MSSAKALALAIRALHPAVPAAPTRYDGQAPTGAVLPRSVLNQSVPGIVSRSEAGTPHGQVGRVRITVVGGTEDAVLIGLDQVLPAFEGVRVAVAGWLTSPLHCVDENGVHIYPDVEVTLAGGNHPIVGVATFEYTVTATA